MKRITGLAALLLIGLSIWIFGSQPTRPRSLVLISLDTLRADRLGAYGYGRPTSPTLDQLATSGVVFDKMIAVSSWTLPTHLTLLTGLYPSSHGITHWQRGALSPDRLLLAERLKKAGYRTAAVTGGGYVGQRFGFARGFDEYSQLVSRKHLETGSFPIAVQRAQQFLATVPSDQPYFLFLHTYDIHCPYVPPAAYAQQFLSKGAKQTQYTNCLQGKQKREVTFDAGERQYLSDMYDASIRQVDDNLGDLVRSLKARADFADTVIVIFSDHGEEFFEHGKLGHEGTLYNEVLHVPCLIVAPHLAPRRVAQQVSHVDVLPTILQLLSLEVPAALDGVSLVPLMEGATAPTRAFQFSELSWHGDLRSRYSDEHHLIATQGTKEQELFALPVDPLEQRNLAQQHPETAEALRAELDAFADGLTSSPPEALPDASREHLEELKTLGYL